MFEFLKASEVMSRLGKPPVTSRTPSEVVYRENKLRVLHYLPTTRDVLPFPVLIVSSLINKYYILDLMPGKSFVEYLTARGFAVYMIDWGTPDDFDRQVTLEDYIDGYMGRVVAEVLRHSGSKQLSLVGYCMGGTMALLYAARHAAAVKNIVLLATPVDFENESFLHLQALWFMRARGCTVRARRFLLTPLLIERSPSQRAVCGQTRRSALGPIERP